MLIPLNRGTYKVVYEAKDSSGNTATAERKVVVHKEYNYKELKKIVKKLMKKVHTRI